MSTFAILNEPTTIGVSPGKRIYLEHPLNRADVLDITLDWTVWLGSDTISSVAWSAENDLSISGESNTTTTASATLTAGSVTADKYAECQITTAGGQKRSVQVCVEIHDLSPWD